MDAKPAMNENKIKNQKRSWCTIPPLSKEKEKEKHGIKLRESKVVLYVDQWDRDKQKSSDLGTNWLDVYFNLTKGMIEFLLSN